MNENLFAIVVFCVVKTVLDERAFTHEPVWVFNYIAIKLITHRRTRTHSTCHPPVFGGGRAVPLPPVLEPVAHLGGR